MAKINLFGFTGKNKVENTSDRQQELAKKYGMDLKQILLARDEATLRRARQIIIELKAQSQALTRQDISRLRNAESNAISAENPVRYPLIDIYYDIAKDLHMSGAIANRTLPILHRNFKVVNAKTEEENEELTKRLKASWFRQFCRHALDSRYWGFSVVELGDIVTDEIVGMKFRKVSLIPRRHCNPYWGTVVKQLSDDAKKGIDYRKPPYSDWVIEIGEPDDLGLFLKLGFHALPKKNVLGFWDQFSEVFGMPIRIGKTTSRDKKDLDKMEDMLENMGSASWALFQDGTDIEIKETTRGDAYQVYDKRIERANSEMSKAILGTTMMMDSGSSRSQAEVHERVSEEIIQDDADFLLDVINDQLLPVCNKHGFGFNGHIFTWDESYDYTEGQMMEIEKMLLEHYDIDPDYFQEKYSINIIGKKERQPFGLAAEKKKPFEHQLNAIYTTNCECCGGVQLSAPELKIVLDLTPNTWKEAQRIAKDMFKGVYPAGNMIDEILTVFIIEQLKQGLFRGYKKTFNDVDFNTPDYAMLSSLQKDVYQFASAKNYHQLKDMNAALLDEAGKPRTFAQFRAECEQINKQYNVAWLQTEYVTAVNSATSAARWVEYQERKEVLPMLRYDTAGDERVSDDHRLLDGVIRKVDDSFWNTYYPPNRWRCRCSVSQHSVDKVETDRDKIVYPAVQPMFKTNLAKTGMLFPPKHPYFDMPEADKARVINAADQLLIKNR